MDDYSMTSLNESKNEWCARLVNTLSPTIVQGLKSIFEEAWSLCMTNDEEDKYLMTFQTFLSRVPKWNPTIIEAERKRITETSGCGYLEELITCVHIIQLKSLSCVRVGQKQKKIDIDIPSVDMFIHKVYINVARKVYTNIYLFEKNIAPLQIQKNNREVELIIRECVLNSVRESIPVETILRAYMAETEEKEIVVSEVEEVLPPLPAPVKPPVEQIQSQIKEQAQAQEKTTAEKEKAPALIITKADDPIPFTPAINISTTRLSFADIDNAVDTAGSQYKIEAPKTIERLEQISEENHRRNMLAEASSNEDDNNGEYERLSIGEPIKLNITDINDISRNLNLSSLNPPILDGIETLY